MPVNRKFRALLAACVIVMLLALPVGLTYRRWQQARLDHALVQAVKANRAAEISRLLNRDANPMAEDVPIPTFLQMARFALLHVSLRAPANPVVAQAARNQH